MMRTVWSPNRLAPPVGALGARTKSRPASSTPTTVIAAYRRRWRAGQAPSGRPGHVQPDRNEVDEPGQDLDDDGRVLDAEHAGEQAGLHLTRAGPAGQVGELSWPALSQPASCAVWTALTTRPAATRTSTTPVARKNLERLSLTPPR